MARRFYSIALIDQSALNLMIKDDSNHRYSKSKSVLNPNNKSTPKFASVIEMSKGKSVDNTLFKRRSSMLVRDLM